MACGDTDAFSIQIQVFEYYSGRGGGGGGGGSPPVCNTRTVLFFVIIYCSTPLSVLVYRVHSDSIIVILGNL